MSIITWMLVSYPTSASLKVTSLTCVLQWVPRDVLSDSGPKTIQQVREEAAKVCTVGVLCCH